MKPLSQLLPGRAEKLDHGDTYNDEESLASEDQSFLPGRRLRPAARRQAMIENLRSLLILLLLTSGIILILVTAYGQAFPRDHLLETTPATQASEKGVFSLQTNILEKPCGSSPEEAREHGCVFDNMVFAWVHPRCWDEELSHGFRDTKFKFSLGPNNTDPVPQDEAYKGNYPDLYVNWE
jgi:hypothetical protein